MKFEMFQKRSKRDAKSLPARFSLKKFRIFRFLDMAQKTFSISSVTAAILFISSIIFCDMSFKAIFSVLFTLIRKIKLYIITPHFQSFHIYYNEELVRYINMILAVANNN